MDKALRLHGERLQAFERLGDVREKAATLWDIYQIQLQKGNLQEALKFLIESYQINLQLGRLDGICTVGLELGSILLQSDNKEEGMKILERSREGYIRLGRNDYADEVQKIILQAQRR